MKKKGSKKTSRKETTEKNRAPYLWYLRPPFDREFQLVKWWSDTEPNESLAAAYEIARRHPLVGELRTRFHGSTWYGQELREELEGEAQIGWLEAAAADLRSEPTALRCLCLIGLRAWSDLPEGWRESWADSIGKFGGMDYRDPYKMFTWVTGEAQLVYSLKQFDRFTRSMATLTATPWRAESKSMPSKPEEKGLDQTAEPDPYEQTIMAHALKAHRSGMILLAIKPDMSLEKAQERLAELSKRFREAAHKKQRNRSRHEDWLKVIDAFEKGGPIVTKSTTQPFVRYKRVMDKLKFE